MFRDVPECSGMFRNVLECSMFLILSTTVAVAPVVYQLWSASRSGIFRIWKVTAKNESFSTAAGSGSRIDDSSTAGSEKWLAEADIDSVKSTGVLSAIGVLSDSDRDRQVTQRQSMEAPVCTAKR